MEPRTALRTALAAGPATLAPGAYDALSARIVEAAGFPVLYGTRGGISRRMGYRIVIIPSDLQRAAIRAMQEVAAAIRRDGDSTAVAHRLATFQEREALVGLERVQALEARYLRAGTDAPGETARKAR